MLRPANNPTPMHFRPLLTRTLLTLAAVCWLGGAALAQTTVVQVIINSEAHDTLEAAVIAAGLDDDLGSEGPFTVFAPTDEAFAALEAAAPGTIEALLGDTALLASILRYHVLGARVAASDIPAGQSYANSLNNQLSIQLVNDDGIVLNARATVTESIEADNGIVHVIDAVILPLSVADVVRVSPAHSTLEVALDTGNYLGTLGRNDLTPLTLTLWAPTNAAFDAIDGDVLDDLLTNRDSRPTLESILQYHLLALNTDGAPLTTDLLGDRLFFFTTLNFTGGDQGFVQQVNGGGDTSVTVNNVTPEVFNIRATNGVVYSIGEVLTPPSTADFVEISVIHNTLEAALEATDLQETLDDPDGSFTLIAPTDGAFGSTLTDEQIDALVADPDALRPILLYHALDSVLSADEIPDGLSFQNSIATFTQQYVSETDDEDETTITVDNLELGTTDRKTTNGTVHILGSGVLLPPSVLDIAARSPVHTTLEMLVGDAGLVETLDDEDAAFTVFAPTDEAFAAVPDTTLTAIVEEGLLSAVLTYHVLPAVVPADTIITNELTSATTVEGSDVTIAVTDGGVVLNGDVNVVITDIRGTNGIVHVVDGVLVPEGLFSSVTATAAEAGIAVGPIPADDYTVVSLPGSLADGTRLELFDARGQLVRAQALTGGRERVELGDLSAGTYFMTFVTAHARYLQPIVVQ